jgi:hypothetical protein
MNRILIAFRAFFAALFNGAAAARIDLALREADAPPPGGTMTSAQLAQAPTVIMPQTAKRQARNDALNLLAALQRESRLIDFLQEPLDGYSDAQIGAAVRDVHRDAAAALRRMFELRPLTDQPEDTAIEVAAGADAVRYRLTGNVTGSAPYRGRIRHHGWQAARCDLPEWTGGAEAQTVVAPIEVEVS